MKHTPELRVFGTKEDKAFWSDKPIQSGHPEYKPKAAMDLKEAVATLDVYQAYNKDRDYTMKAPHGVKQALETVIAAVKRADLTDEEIDQFVYNGKYPTTYDAKYKLGQQNGARHVRDLLHGEGKE